MLPGQPAGNMLVYLMRTRARREQWFRLVYELKWIIAVALAAAGLFALPAQTIEPYRILHASRTLTDLSRIFLPLAITCTSILGCCRHSLCRLRRHHLATATFDEDPCTGASNSPWRGSDFRRRLGPIQCPPANVAAGHQPQSVGRRQPVGDTASDLARDLGDALPLGAATALAQALVALVVWDCMTALLPACLPGWRALTVVSAAILAIVLGIVLLLVPLPRCVGVFGVFAVFAALLAASAARLTLTSLRVPREGRR